MTTTERLAQPPRQSHLKHFPLPFSNPNNQRRPASANPHVNTKPGSVGVSKVPRATKPPIGPGATTTPGRPPDLLTIGAGPELKLGGLVGSASPPRMPPSDRGPRGSRADRLCPPPGSIRGSTGQDPEPAGGPCIVVREGRSGVGGCGDDGDGVSFLPEWVGALHLPGVCRGAGFEGHGGEAAKSVSLSTSGRCRC